MCLAGCSTLPQPSLLANISTSSQLNPNRQGRASPLVVTFYQLKSPQTFLSTDFNQLYNNPKKALGDDFFSSTQQVFLPDKNQVFNLTLDKKTQYVGIVAAYSNLSNAQWRELIKIKTDKKSSKITIVFNNNNISIKE